MKKLTITILILIFLALLSNTAQAFTLEELRDTLNPLFGKVIDDKEELPLPQQPGTSQSSDYNRLCDIMDPARICKFE